MTAPSSIPSGLYYESSIPMGLYALLNNAVGSRRDDPNLPRADAPSGGQAWISQPRSCTDPTTEVWQANFKEPVSITRISFDVLRVGVSVEAWYRDRLGNWRQMLDDNYVPITLALSASSVENWYSAHFLTYPIVAKSIQFRLKRLGDVGSSLAPYSVGLRKILPRRDVYNRHQGIQQINDRQDALGNVITSYVKDWQPSNILPGNGSGTSYWRSAPQPDPAAVVNLYADLRVAGGTPQAIDNLFLDPVYVNQNLNVYYSNDDTVGTLTLSPLSAVPTTDINTTWQLGTGRWDSSTTSEHSQYSVPMSWGPLINQDCWFGIEWTPNFDAASGPPLVPKLLEVIPSNPGSYRPVLYYDTGAGKMVLQITDGTDSTPLPFAVRIDPLFSKGDILRIVAGWTYTAPGVATVTLQVTNSYGTELTDPTTSTQTAVTLPSTISLDGTIQMENFQGKVTAYIIKLEDWQKSYQSFQANALMYVNPDPATPDATGSVVSSTLDNAIYAADFTAQEWGIGGAHESFYTAKTWTPILANYVTARGFLYFPKQITAKYLKLEFSNLTEEPYPIYDAGVRVTYQTFPASVIAQANPQNQGNSSGGSAGLLSAGASVSFNGVGSVNWLSPASVTAATNAAYGQTVPPVLVIASAPSTTLALPNTGGSTMSSRSEMSSPWVYKRTLLSSSTLARQQINVAASGDSLQSGYGSAVTPLSATAAGAFTPMLPTASNTGATGVQGADWWQFPGGQLQIPARVMQSLTAVTDVVVGRKSSTETRPRFLSSSVHYYDTRTAIRDAAVAYYAGVHELSVWRKSYLSVIDDLVLDFTNYQSEWSLSSNVVELDSGPIGVQPNPYTLPNAGFALTLDNWTATGPWYWSGTNGYDVDLGCAAVNANRLRVDGGSPVVSTTDAVDGGSSTDTGTGIEDGGTSTGSGADPYTLVSAPVPVTPGDQLVVSGWVNYTGTSSLPGGAITLDLVTYSSTVMGSAPLGASAVISQPTGSLDGRYFQNLTGSYTVPAGVDHVALRFSVNDDVTQGVVYFDSAAIWPTSDGTWTGVIGTFYKHFTTEATVDKITCDFADSGLLRSDSMWAAIDLTDTNISATALAYYTDTIPDKIPSGAWSDTFSDWSDSTTDWGEPYSQIALNVDPVRTYQGRRVLHFTRGTMAGESGVKVRQVTNLEPGSFVRINAIWLKPNANSNSIVLRLRRVSDGVYISETELTNPAAGYWYTYQGLFFELPTGTDQLYTLELTCKGDVADELYLSDLWLDVALVRYVIQLGDAPYYSGDSSGFAHEVTDLVYGNDGTAIVSNTVPVTTFSVRGSIHSSRAWAYGCTITPNYLK